MGTISRTKARQIAVDLKKKGLHDSEIGSELAKAGYVSDKTGKALTQGGVSALINHTAAWKARRAKTTTTAAPLTAIQEILSMKHVDAETRIAIAQLVAEHAA
jgi:hypothetical protein